MIVPVTLDGPLLAAAAPSADTDGLGTATAALGDGSGLTDTDGLADTDGFALGLADTTGAAVGAADALVAASGAFVGVAGAPA